MTEAERNPRRAMDARVRKVEGELLVAGDLDVYELSEVAAEIWSLADGSRPVSEIADEITARYDVTPEAALRDVRALLNELAEARLLEWV